MAVSRFRLAAAVVVTIVSSLPCVARAVEPIGMLECTVEPGVGFGVSSSKGLNCSFRPERGRPEYYVGTMRRMGLDVGITGPGVLNWAVFAIDGAAPRFALTGKFVGATAELSLAAGLGANALVGGNANMISLQPISFNAAFGISLAAGVGEIVLRPAPPSAIH